MRPFHSDDAPPIRFQKLFEFSAICFHGHIPSIHFTECEVLIVSSFRVSFHFFTVCVFIYTFNFVSTPPTPVIPELDVGIHVMLWLGLVIEC